MANSGNVRTGVIASGSGRGNNIYVQCDWWIDNIDNINGTGILHWNLYAANEGGYSTAFLLWNRNWFGVNDVERWALAKGTGSQSNPYPLLTGGYEKSTFWASEESGYYGIDGWAYRIKYLSSGQIPLSYNDDGYTSFRLNGAFSCNSAYSWGSFDTGWYTPDKIERFNKSRVSTNSGSSWSNDKYFWKTTDYGQTWKRCNGYRSTNNGNSWQKV